LQKIIDTTRKRIFGNLFKSMVDIYWSRNFVEKEPIQKQGDANHNQRVTHVSTDGMR